MTKFIAKDRGLDRGEAALETAPLFSFIGATPRTDWLPPEIEKDELCPDRHHPDGIASLELKRHPFLLETSRPGLFAAGDVRSGSIKRVASAVGEGFRAGSDVGAASCG
jgi:thioredoxin reductase (NADPH)